MELILEPVLIGCAEVLANAAVRVEFGVEGFHGFLRQANPVGVAVLALALARHVVLGVNGLHNGNHVFCGRFCFQPQLFQAVRHEHSSLTMRFFAVMIEVGLCAWGCFRASGAAPFYYAGRSHLLPSASRCRFRSR